MSNSGDLLSQIPVSAQSWLEGGQLIPVHDGFEVVQVYVRVEGGPAVSETIFLIPDIFSSSYLFRNIVGPLTQKGFRVVTFDFPGTGLSHHRNSKKAFTHDGLVEFIATVSEALQLRPTHLVLHASSARAGLDYAIKYPKRVRSISFVAANHDGQVAFTPSSALRTPVGTAILRSPLGALLLQVYLKYNGANFLSFADAQAYAFFMANSAVESILKAESKPRSLVDDLHHKIQLPSIWIHLNEGKFVATSKHDLDFVSPQTYFVLEDYATTSIQAIASFINSLEATPLPKPEPIPAHILEQLQAGHGHSHDHGHHGHGHSHDHGMGNKYGL